MTQRPPVIRRGEPADRVAVAAIYRSASLANERDRAALLLRPELLEFDDGPPHDGRVLVAVDKAVLGFLEYAARGEVFDLESLFVAPQWQRRGVATALVAALAALAATSDATRLELVANAAAVPFYAAVGFVGERDLDTALGVARLMVRSVTGPGPDP